MENVKENNEFKGTPGPLEPKYHRNICIGVGTSGAYSQITCNTILPTTDKEYEAEKEEIEANMTLYAAAPDLLATLQELMSKFESDGHLLNFNVDRARKAIRKALNP